MFLSRSIIWIVITDPLGRGRLLVIANTTFLYYTRMDTYIYKTYTYPERNRDNKDHPANGVIQ